MVKKKIYDSELILTDDEKDVITKLREEKKIKEKTLSLESKFREVYDKANEEINSCLDKANEQLALAVKISDESGIPFYCDLISMSRGRNYKPGSFYYKWNDITQSIINEFNINVNVNTDSGWEYLEEYWQSSSQNC